MNLDKYSKIGIIVIAVIVSINFTDAIWSRGLAPYIQSIRYQWQEQKRTKAYKDDREKNAFLYNCYAEVDKKKSDARDGGWGHGCTNDSKRSHGLLPDCYWSHMTEISRTHDSERKNCEMKFPKVD